MIALAALHSYPVKSCRGIDHASALLTDAGLEHDREWMFVAAGGRFISQREEPRLARVEVALHDGTLRLWEAGVGDLRVTPDAGGAPVQVTVWDDEIAAIDQGDAAAEWAGTLLGREVRLVRFDPGTRRLSNSRWTGATPAYNRFSDGFPLLAVSRASLDDLNSRLPVPLPMSRFRPNLVIDGLPAFGEDALHDIESDGVRLRFVKACARCVITTTDQRTGVVTGDEPVRTLKTYRWNSDVRGVAFGQNVIVVKGAGQTLHRGQQFRAAPG